MGTVQAKDKKDADKKKQNLDLKSIFHLAVQVGCNLQLDDVVNATLDNILKLKDSITAADLFLLNKDKKFLFVKAQRGLSPEFVGAGTLQVGEGLAGHVAKSGEILQIDDLSEDNRLNGQLVKKEKLVSYVGIPLYHEGTSVGVLELYTRSHLTFSNEECQLLIDLGCHVGTAIHNAIVFEQAAVRARRYVTISRAIAVTRQLGTLDEVLTDIAKVLVQSLGFDQSWIGLINSENILSGHTGFGVGMKGKTLSTRYPITSASKNPAVMAISKQDPVIFQFVEDVQDSEFRSWIDSLNVQSFGYVPIVNNETAVGVVGVFYTTDQAFEEEDVKTLCSIAEQAAIAIENAQLYEQIKTSEERYRTLFERTGTCLATLDEALQFKLVNHAFESLSGYSRKELVEKMSLLPFLFPKIKPDSDVEQLLRIVDQGWEAEFTDRDKTVKHIHIMTTTIPGSSDLLVSLIDITQQRELERRLFRSEELAAIGELSAGIAHEIRNPLVAINTSASLLKDEAGVSVEGQQLLGVVKEETDHLAAIVDDFLQFAKPKKSVFEEEDVNQLLKDVVKRYKDFDETKIEWIEKYDENLPSAYLDRHQFQQVITNLLLNSLDALQKSGRLTIQSQTCKKNQEDCIQILISDTGIGIPSKELPKIFQPFFSLKEKGTGVGLAICQRIVDDHNGEIHVESKLKSGTSFTVTLPVLHKDN